MPRLYSPVQNSAYFVGMSARQDAASDRAHQRRQETALQRRQSYATRRQYTQASRVNQQVQRQAQQQQALQTQQRREDRDFQQQRDVFGAQRDYGMQERRIGAAAEQSQLGREFETEQLDTRFGQQQDMAWQEQEYRLEQLDIAAQDRFLSTDQQGEIQRESDILRSDLNRRAASEGRFEQFEYGQLAAEEAARRPLSVAERQRLRFGDELDARRQRRGADITSGQITQRDELGREATRDRVNLETESRERLGKISHEQAIELRTLIGDQAFNAQDESHRQALDRLEFNANLEADAKVRDKDLFRKRQLTEAKENELGHRLQKLRQNASRFGGKGSPEYAEREREIRADVDEMSDAEFRIGPSAQTEADRDKVQIGKSTFVKTGNGLQLVDKEEPPLILNGETVEDGKPFPYMGKIYLKTPRGMSAIAETPEAEEKTRTNARNESRERAEHTALMRHLDQMVNSENAVGDKTQEPLYTPEKKRDLLEAHYKKWNKILSPPPPVEPEEPVGTGGWDPAVGAGPRDLPATDVPPPEDEATGDWAEDPHAQIIADEAAAAESGQSAAAEFDKIRNRPVNKVWAENQMKLIEAKNSGRELKDWSPQDLATYMKAVSDMESGEAAEALRGKPEGARPSSGKGWTGTYPFRRRIE